MPPINLTQLCQDLALAFTRQPSVTGTADEAAFGPWLASHLRAQTCFGDTPEIWSFPVANGDARHCVALLIRGTGVDTVLLTGHYDTVTTADYGDLQPLAIDPPALAQALLRRVKDAAPGTREALLREDLASGRFLPGRGLLDMKAGLAAGLAAMAALVQDGPPPANLLFLAVPDEENASAGARGAARALPQILSTRGLGLRVAINLDAIADDGDGRAGRVLALGTVGKVLPTALVIGAPVHSGFPLRGVNAAVLAGAIAQALEWAPELTDDTGTEPGTPISLLSLKDGKAGYDVTTPATAFATFSVLNQTRDPATVLPIVARLVDRAVSECVSVLAKRAAKSGQTKGIIGAPLSVPILFYADLLSLVRAAGPAIDELQATEARRLSASGASLADICQTLTTDLWARSGLTGPAVVLGLGSTPYLATHLRNAAVEAAARSLAADCAQAHVTSLSCVDYFAGISDMSFFGQAPAGAFTALAAQTPGWNTLVGLGPDSIANVPTVNLGPWGRDYHTPHERIEIDYGFRILPRLLRDLVLRILATPT